MISLSYNWMILYQTNWAIVMLWQNDQTFCKTQYIKRQPTYLATLNHLKEILPDRTGGLNCLSSTSTKRTVNSSNKHSFLPDLQIALKELLTDVKNKICSLDKSEKSCRLHWLVKKARNDFKSNHFNAGKALLGTKCYANLKVEQVDLDKHKSSSLNDIDYDIPLVDLEGLPDKPPLLKSFPKNWFCFEDFFQILSSQRNASACGLNRISCKVYKKYPKINKFLFKIFLSCINIGTIPLLWQSAKEIYIPNVKPLTEYNTLFF